IVLLLLFPAALWLLLFRPSLALGASVLLYVLTWHFNWNMPSYPEGHWYFNPFAWQLLFVFGAWCALGGAQRLAAGLQGRGTLGVAAAYLFFAFVISLSRYLPRVGQFVPHWLGTALYPVSTVNPAPFAFRPFLALWG